MWKLDSRIPAEIYMFKVINANTRTRHEMCLNITTKTPEQRHIVAFWTYSTFCSGVFIANFEQANTGWEVVHSVNNVYTYYKRDLLYKIK